MKKERVGVVQTYNKLYLLCKIVIELRVVNYIMLNRASACTDVSQRSGRVWLEGWCSLQTTYTQCSSAFPQYRKQSRRLTAVDNMRARRYFGAARCSPVQTTTRFFQVLKLAFYNNVLCTGCIRFMLMQEARTATHWLHPDPDLLFLITLYPQRTSPAPIRERG